MAYTDYSFSPLQVEYNKKSGAFKLVANKALNGKTDDESIGLYGYYVLNTGEYTLGYKLDTLITKGYAAYAPPYQVITSYKYLSNKKYTGKLVINTLDTISRIISGTFKADLAYYDTSASDTNIFQIRNGRFDVTY